MTVNIFPAMPVWTARISTAFSACPLYALGERCGGNFTYSPQGVKDCSNCLVPHRVENYDKICARFAEIAALCRKNDG